MTRSSHAGFTLIEVLVGTTIVGIMISLLTSALFGIARTARAGDARFGEVDAARLVQSFLRHQLTEVVPLTDVAGEEPQLLFDGRPDGLRFVGHLPAHRGGGGLQFIEVKVDPRSTDRALTLFYRNAWPDTPFEPLAGSAAEHRALVTGVERIRLRYYGAMDDEARPAWRDTWENADRLPALVELNVDMADGRSWQRIVAAVASRTAVAQTRLFRRHEGAP